MILNTGCRTDIPGVYSEWFFNRVRDGYVLARDARLHDPNSPLLIGHLLPSDTVKDVPQASYIDPQGTLF